MPEANLFLMFTQRLNTLGVAYMVSSSMAVIISYCNLRLCTLLCTLEQEHPT